MIHWGVWKCSSTKIIFLSGVERFSQLLIVPWVLGKGILLFLVKSNPFSTTQTCHSLYWRTLSLCVLKVFIIKLVCRAILTINSISWCGIYRPFLELLWLSTASPYSLPLVSTAIQPLLLSQQNQLQLLSCLTVLQLVAAAPFPQCPKEELNGWVHKPRFCWSEGSKICIAWESVLQRDGRGGDASAVLTVGWHAPAAGNWMRERKEVHRLESPPSSFV